MQFLYEQDMIIFSINQTILIVGLLTGFPYFVKYIFDKSIWDGP